MRKNIFSFKNTQNLQIPQKIEEFTAKKIPFLLNFLRVATLGVGNFDPVSFFTTSAVFLPETLITAMPDIPGPVDNA